MPLHFGRDNCLFLFFIFELLVFIIIASYVADVQKYLKEWNNIATY